MTLRPLGDRALSLTDWLPARYNCQTYKRTYRTLQLLKRLPRADCRKKWNVDFTFSFFNYVIAVNILQTNEDETAALLVLIEKHSIKKVSENRTKNLDFD